jgi:hypothetical protein
MPLECSILREDVIWDAQCFRHYIAIEIPIHSFRFKSGAGELKL